MKAKEDHRQSGPSMSIKTWQDQEESIEDLPATLRQNRSLDHNQQTAEQTERQTVCQPTLQGIESPTWCMKERGNS